jgi:hypothetical protein
MRLPYLCFGRRQLNMKITRKIICFIILSYVLVGSIGVQIFIHSCQEDGVSKSFGIKLEHVCEHDKHAANKLKQSCCHTNIQKNCCSDQVQVVYYEFDYFQNFDLNYFLVEQRDIKPIFFQNKALVKKKLIIPHLRPPPKLAGTKLLIAIQTFRI